MYKTLRKVLLLFLVTTALVCGTLFAVACGKKGGGGNGDEAQALAAPSGVAIDDDGILSWNAVDHASGYIVYDGDSAIASDIASNVHSYDLNDANLAAGNHSISVAAKGDGVNYKDSPKSSAVSYNVPGAGDDADGSLAHPYKLDEDFQERIPGQLARSILIDLGADETIYYWAKLSEIKSFAFVSLDAPGLVISVYNDPSSDAIATIEADSDNDDQLVGEVVVDADKDYYFAFSIADGSAASYYVTVIKSDVVVEVPGSSAENAIEIKQLGEVVVENLAIYDDRYYSYEVTSADEKLYFSIGENNILLVVSYENDNDGNISIWSNNPDDLKKLIRGVGIPAGTKIIIQVTNLSNADPVSFTIANEPLEVLPEDLPAPDGVRIQGNVLSWNSVNNAIGYIIYKDGEAVDDSRDSSYIIPSDLEPGTYYYSVAAKGDGENYLTSAPSSPAVEYVVGNSYTLTIGEKLSDVVIGTSASPTTLVLSGIDTNGNTAYDVVVEAASGLTITLVHGSSPYTLTEGDGSYVLNSQYLWYSSVQIYASEQVTASITISSHAAEQPDDDLVFELNVDKSISLVNGESKTYQFTASAAGTYKIELSGDITPGDVSVNNGENIINGETGLEAEFIVSLAGGTVYFDISCQKADGVTFTAKISYVGEIAEEDRDLVADGDPISVTLSVSEDAPTELNLVNVKPGFEYTFVITNPSVASRASFYMLYNNGARKTMAMDADDNYYIKAKFVAVEDVNTLYFYSNYSESEDIIKVEVKLVEGEEVGVPGGLVEVGSHTINQSGISYELTEVISLADLGLVAGETYTLKITGEDALKAAYQIKNGTTSFAAFGHILESWPNNYADVVELELEIPSGCTALTIYSDGFGADDTCNVTLTFLKVVSGPVEVASHTINKSGISYELTEVISLADLGLVAGETYTLKISGEDALKAAYQIKNGTTSFAAFGHILESWPNNYADIVELEITIPSGCTELTIYSDGFGANDTCNVTLTFIK